MPDHTKPLILVDGSSYLYRAFHAMPSLTNSKKSPTGAIYGVINMLKKLLLDHQPESIAVVFDAKGKTFRDAIYDQYKANRSAMPEDLVKQIEPIHAIIKAMGLPILMVDGVEADDVIGTLARQAAQKQRHTLISTGDKDLAQLVDDHVTLVNTMTDTYLNPQTVVDKFGIPPERIIDYLALVGDTSDNIPGVPQVGPKTAVKWLLQYGTLDNIIKHANDIKGKVGENLRASLHQIPLAKQLATIKLDVPLAVTIDQLQRGQENTEQLIELYRDCEFKSWLSALLSKQTTTTVKAMPTHHETLVDTTAFSAWLKELNTCSEFAFATKTNSSDYMQANIVGLSFVIPKGKTVYIPLAHDDAFAPTQLSRDVVLRMLKPIFENPAIHKISQHSKYDIEVLANHGITLKGIIADTLLESYVLDSAGNHHDIEALSLKYLGTRTLPLEEIAGKGAKQISFDKISVEKAARFATEEIDATLQVHQLLITRITEQPQLLDILNHIEIPLSSVLARIERTGVLVDDKKLEQQTKELETRTHELEQEAYSMAKMPFNMNSPKQLQEILFTQLNLPVLQKTPTGQASTADAVLQELALEYPLPKIIIEYRSLTKLISTYTKRLPEQINPTTGRIHTSYNQTGASTGRLSSSDPNLQNIPVRTKEGRRIRQAFIAPQGFKIVSADYSQIELRIMAHISQDEALLKAFKNDLDIHLATAAEILELPLDQVTSDQRRSAKAVNFGLIYGMSAFGLAKQLGVDRHTAQAYIEKYFARYPGVKRYMENTRNQAHEQSYVETLRGRRLYLPEINSSQIMRQKAAERAAINAPLQGTAADIIKTAMINIDKWLADSQLPARMIMQVHDELVFEVAETELESVIQSVRDFMMQAASLDVPLNVSIGSGDNWDAASAH